jgi:hypothetical protein
VTLKTRLLLLHKYSIICWFTLVREVTKKKRKRKRKVNQWGIILKAKIQKANNEQTLLKYACIEDISSNKWHDNARPHTSRGHYGRNWEIEFCHLATSSVQFKLGALGISFPSKTAKGFRGHPCAFNEGAERKPKPDCGKKVRGLSDTGLSFAKLCTFIWSLSGKQIQISKWYILRQGWPISNHRRTA